MTDFKQVADNAKAVAPLNSLNNTTDPLTVSGIDTRRLPVLDNGYWLTVYDKITYPDPSDDPHMEKVLVTDITIAASGEVTILRGQLGTTAVAHTGQPAMELLVVSQLVKDLYTAVNAAEGDILTKEAAIVAGSTSQYWRGDKSWQTLNKAAVGLSAVPNTDATARANHTGTQSADTLTDGTTNKAFLATERTKLAGIATGATANSSDATLLARVNHTGTQTASTISDFSTAADARITAQKGIALGLATLDSGGKVPSSQLPAYVDDVLEYANLAGFPVTGTASIIYVALDSNKTYRWSGSTYVEISPSEVLSVNGQVGVVTITAAGLGAPVAANNLSDLTSVSTARSNLGLGSMALQAASTVAITGGTITGITDLAIADGGTGASSAATAFGNLKQSATTGATGVIQLAGDLGGTATSPTVPNKVTGPASAVDNALVRYDGTTGKLVQDSNATLDDNGLLYVSTSLATSASPLAKFEVLNGAFGRYGVHIVSAATDLTADVLRVTATSGARAIFIEQLKDAGSLIIDASAAPNTVSGSNQTVFAIQGNNNAFSMAKFVNQAVSSTNNSNVFIQNTGAATTARGLQIDQQGVGSALYIDQASTTNPAIEVNTGKFGIKTTITISGGYGINLATNGTATLSPSNGLLRLAHTTTADTAPLLFMDNRTAGNSVTIKNNATTLLTVSAVGEIAGATITPSGTNSALTVGATTGRAALFNGDIYVKGQQTSAYGNAGSQVIIEPYENGIPPGGATPYSPYARIGFNSEKIALDSTHEPAVVMSVHKYHADGTTHQHFSIYTRTNLDGTYTNYDNRLDLTYGSQIAEWKFMSSRLFSEFIQTDQAAVDFNHIPTNSNAVIGNVFSFANTPRVTDSGSYTLANNTVAISVGKATDPLYTVGTIVQNSNALRIDHNGDGGRSIYVTHAGTTTDAIEVNIENVMASSKRGLHVYSAAAQTNSELVVLELTSASSNKAVLRLVNSGSGPALSITTPGTPGAIVLGGDANLYRSAADTLKTDDSFIVAGTSLTIGSLSGVLKASSGVVSGGATTSDLSEGSNLYYTTTRADGRIAAAIGVSVQPYSAATTLLGNTTIGSGAIVLAASPTITGTLTAANITATGTLLNTGDARLSGYLRLGSTSAPANTTAGDLTAVRLNLGNGSFPTTESPVNVTGTMTTTSSSSPAFANFQNTITPTTNSATNFRALQFANIVNPATGITFTGLAGIQSVYLENRVRSDGSIGSLIGANINPFIVDSSSAATATATLVTGIQINAIGRPSGTTAPTITTVLGYDFQMVAAGLTSTTVTGYRMTNPGANTITNLIGADIAALTRGSALNVGLRIAAPSGATANYALQLSDTGGAAAGGITFGTDVQLYRSAAATLAITDGSSLNIGATTGLKIGTVSTQKLGFLGASPVAQQTGGVATAGASYTGTEQGMIQKAYDTLRAFGLLS